MTRLTTPRLISARFQDAEDEPVALSEVPSTGASRPGPILNNVTVGVEPIDAGETVAEVPEGVAPSSFQVADFGVDAPIEMGEIVNGAMVDPSGPWVITWYHQLGRLGQGTNVVAAGHVDYFNVGPAVLWTAKDPGWAPGTIVQMTAEDGSVFQYAVEWSQQYHISELTPEVIQTQIVNHTGYEALTIVTCGGEWDGAHYTSRIVVRANAI